jgi:uncharacterized protein (DUF1800 family)
MFTALLAFNISHLNASSINIETDEEAARLLMQGTFGPTLQDIAQAKNSDTYKTWIEDQFNKPASYMAPQLQAIGVKLREEHRQAVWWKNTIKGSDQLRQRMAYALSEILVIGPYPGGGNNILGKGAYYDIFMEHAFGNYKDILKKVSRNPLMGAYLSFAYNKKANPKKNTHPDENYAREIMQLFTIGLIELNNDGTPLKEDGKELATYTQTDIANMARVFTGWQPKTSAEHIIPMNCNQTNHDYGEKVVMGRTIPANLSCEEDMDKAIDILFNHPNTPPFISKQLIQKFTTSNPSPEYVQAVADKFIDNGNGVRGDLKAVIKEILLHEEARITNFSDNFGKIKEPIIRLAGLYRAANALKNKEEPFVKSYLGVFGQTHLDSPSVFNYFRPDYAPTKELSDYSIVAPELQLASDKYIISRMDQYVLITDKTNGKMTNKITLFLANELQLAKK